MTHLTRAALALLIAAGAAGCQSAASSRPSRAASAACRAEVDRVYAAQNRVDLSRRDQRDTPFAASYLPGDTARGLGDRYGRDRMIDSCMSNAAGNTAPAATTDTGTTGTFSPASK